MQQGNLFHRCDANHRTSSQRNDNHSNTGLHVWAVRVRLCVCRFCLFIRFLVVYNRLNHSGIPIFLHQLLACQPDPGSMDPARMPGCHAHVEMAALPIPRAGQPLILQHLELCRASAGLLWGLLWESWMCLCEIGMAHHMMQLTLFQGRFFFSS